MVEMRNFTSCVVDHSKKERSQKVSGDAKANNEIKQSGMKTPKLGAEQRQRGLVSLFC